MPIVIYDHLMPYAASRNATDIISDKGLSSLLGDLGWEFILLLLFAIGFAIPFGLNYIVGLQGFWQFTIPVMFSYLAFIWIYAVLNKAIRIAKIYYSTSSQLTIFDYLYTRGVSNDIK